MRIKADSNVEVWAACDKDTEHQPYAFGCNHILIPAGETRVFPQKYVVTYRDNDGPHLHYRARNREPHSRSTDEWHELPLKTCDCP